MAKAKPKATDKASGPPAPTLALSTKVEEDFVSPLTAIRGAIEILRDTPDLPEKKREMFLRTALQACARLERGVEHLSDAVYSAAREPAPEERETGTGDEDLDDAVAFDEDADTVEFFTSPVVFRSSGDVTAFYDSMERLLAATGQAWYFLINAGNCQVWPEAWVTFAHRSKKLNAAAALGQVRYAEDTDGAAPEIYPTRAAAMAAIAGMR